MILKGNLARVPNEILRAQDSHHSDYQDISSKALATGKFKAKQAKGEMSQEKGDSWTI